MMREDDNGVICSGLQVSTLGTLSYNLLGKEHPTTNELVEIAKMLYGID